MLNKHAFTLIELLVVVLIIGILAAIALPQYQKAVWRSRNTTLKQYVDAIGKAQEIYRLNNSSYSTQFGLLDINLPLKTRAAMASDGNTSCGMGANKSDSVLDGDGFSIVINKSASSHQAVAVVGVWTTGKYKCTGFHLALVAQQFRCVEGASTTAASFTPGSCCKTIEKSQTPNPSPAGIWRYYELP